MQALSPAIEVYPVQHLPIIKAYADQLGLISLINHSVPTAMEVDAGTVMLALVLETLSGRSPLYRLEEFFAQQDTALLLGKTVPSQALNDDTAGRVLDRLYDFGTMRLFTACAVRAAMRFSLERRYVHFDTTSRSVWGEYQYAETQNVPFQVTYGYSKDKRPDLKEHEATFPDQKANVSRTRPPAGCSTTSWGCMCSTFRDKGSSCSI